jgi:hypothetical protein
MMNYHKIVWQEMQVLNAKNNGSQRGLIDISQKDCLEQAGCLFHKNYARGVMSYSVLFERTCAMRQGFLTPGGLWNQSRTYARVVKNQVVLANTINHVFVRCCL